LHVAEPIAQAMSALHQIEASRGARAGELAPVALDAARRALAGLQTQGSSHAAVQQVLEAVAGSLGEVHELAAALRGAPQPQAVPPEPSPGPSAEGGARELAGYGALYGGAYVPRAMQGQPYAQPDIGHGAADRAYSPARVSPHAAPSPDFMQTTPSAGIEPKRIGRASAAAASQPASDQELVHVNAELGAHSASNFYKGLSGTDVVESGGIFIATYQIPRVGQAVQIHLSMPGGYEFDAQGVVRWTRGMSGPGPGGSSDAPPGFGARFTQMSREGWELVQRYVKNREPLFFDDL
jgi:hypothetical protein